MVNKTYFWDLPSHSVTVANEVYEPENIFQQWRVRFSRLFIWDDLVATSKTFLWFDLAHVGWVRTNKIREDDLGWFPEVLCFLNLLPGAKKNPGCEMVILLYFSTFFVCLWSCIVFSPWCIHFYILVFFFSQLLGDFTQLHSCIFFKSVSRPPPRFIYWKSSFPPKSCPIYRVGPYQPVIPGVK